MKFPTALLWWGLVVTLCCTAHARYLLVEEGYLEQLVSTQQAHARLTRELHGSTSISSGGGLDYNIAAPIKETDSGTFSAVGSLSGLGTGSSGYSRVGGGLGYNSDAGHGGSLTLSHIPDFGNQLTGTGKVNLLDTDSHRLDAGAFVTRSFPSSNTGLSDYNAYGGNLGYTYNDKLSTTLSASHTPMFDKTDVSAMSNYNLFRDRDSSLDLSGGVSRSFSPYSSSNWTPSVGIGFTKTW